MSYRKFKCCEVPQCQSTSFETPNKLFIGVPKHPLIRKSWLTLAKLPHEHYLKQSIMHFCEDHFDLPNDMENYMQYKVQGFISHIRMRKDCVPSKFGIKATTISPSVKKRKKRKTKTINTVPPTNTQENLITNNKLVVCGLKITQEHDITDSECDSQIEEDSTEIKSEYEDNCIIKEELDIKPEIIHVVIR